VFVISQSASKDYLRSRHRESQIDKMFPKSRRDYQKEEEQKT
jgi:hypothetical protein